MRPIKLYFYLPIFIFLSNLKELQAQQSDKTFFTGGNICQTETWKLVFHDEFSGSSIDTSKWYTYYPYGPNNSDLCEYCRTHGNEGQIYLDQNVVVSNGTLKLIAKNQSATWLGASRNFTSGMIHSKINNFKYGKFEIICKILSGMGFWPAFWTFGWNDEIDVFELGGDETHEFYSDVHNWNWNGRHIHANQTHALEGTDFSENFHIYAIEWDHFYLRWFLDGILIRTVPKFFTLDGSPVSACAIAPGVYIVNPLFPTDPMSIIANLAIGGPFTNLPDNSTYFPSQFEIDYIRVYQRQPQSGFSDICETQYSIVGASQICDNETYLYHFVGPTRLLNWDVSSNLQIISSDSSTIAVKFVPDSNGQAWIKAIFAPLEACSHKTEERMLIGIGRPSLSITQEETDWCSIFLKADIQPNGLVVTWTIIKDGIMIMSSSLFEVLSGSSMSNIYYYYTYTVSNECGVSEASGSGIIMECEDLIQFTISPNPASNLIHIHIQGAIFQDVEKMYVFSHNTGFIREYDNPGLNFSVNVQDYPEGIYHILLKMVGIEYFFTKTLQIQR